MKKAFRLLILAVLTFAVAACEEEPVVTPSGTDTLPSADVDSTASARVLVLNEGTWGANNASLSLIDNRAGSITADWFADRNGRGLGDLAQDLVVYGNKAYVTVSESGSLEVIDIATGLSTRVDLGTRYPRYIAADGGKLYVSCYNPRSVIRIDTATLAVEATCPLGSYNPEGIAVMGDKVYVASSNISDEQGTYSYDDKVYVIDAATFAAATPLTVGSNPQKVVVLDANRVVVNYWGDYGSAPAGSAIINSAGLVTQLGEELSNMTVDNGTIYGYAITYSADYSTKICVYKKIDGTTLTTSPLLEGCDIENAYAIGIDPANGDIYIATDGDYRTTGEVHCFKADGSRRWQRTAGWFPSKVVFL